MLWFGLTRWSSCILVLWICYTGYCTMGAINASRTLYQTTILNMMNNTASDQMAHFLLLWTDINSYNINFMHTSHVYIHCMYGIEWPWLASPWMQYIVCVHIFILFDLSIVGEQCVVAELHHNKHVLYIIYIFEKGHCTYIFVHM